MMESSLFCRTCNKHCNSSQQLIDHKNSPSHLAKEKKIQDCTVSNAGLLPVPTNAGIEHVTGSGFNTSLVCSEQDSGSNVLTSHSARMEGRSDAKANAKDMPYIMHGSKGRCFVCEIDLTSYDHCSQHVNGKNHAKKVQQLAERERASGESFMQLQPRVFSADYNPQMPDNGVGPRQPLEASNPTAPGVVLQCKVCNVPLSGQQNAREHFAGRKHRKQLTWLKYERGESFLDDFSSDSDETAVLKVVNSFCNNPPPDVVMHPSSFEEHRISPISPLPSEALADKGITSDNSDDNSPSNTNFAVSPCSIKTIPELRRACSENLCENYAKLSLVAKKFDALSLTSGASQISSISDNSMQPSNIFNAGPVNVDVREATEHLMSQVPPAQRSLSCPIESPNGMPTNAPGEFKSNEHCYGFDGMRGHCYACSVELTSKEHALQHLNGEKHKKKSNLFAVRSNDMRHNENDGTAAISTDDNVQPPNIFNAGPVNVDVRVATEHLMSQVPPAQRGLSCPIESPNGMPTNAPGEFTSNEHCYRFDGMRGHCYACCVELTSKELALQHLNGEKHKKKSNWFAVRSNDMRRSENDGAAGISASDLSLVVTKDSNLINKSPAMNEKYVHFSGTTGYCFACKCILLSQQQAEEHIKGRPHERNIEILHQNQQGTIFSQLCEACDVSFTGKIPASQHFSSDKHKRVVELLSCPAFKIEGIEHARMIIDKMGVSWFFCDICRKPLNTKGQLLIHQKSPGHLQEKKNKTENKPQHQENEAQEASGTLLSQTCSTTRAGVSVEKGAISESQRKMLTIAKEPVINAEPTSLWPHYQSSPMTYSQRSEIQSSIGQERHNCQQTADSDENRASQYTFDRQSSSNFGNKKNEPAYREASGSTAPSSSLSSSSSQSIHQNASVGSESTHAYAGNRTGQDLQGSIDTLRKPSSSQITRRGDCLRNINMNNEYDPDFAVNHDSKEKPTTVQNITNEENSQQYRTAPNPRGTSETLIEARDFSGFPFFCELCKRPMNTRDSFNAHMKGNNHLWNLTYSKADDINLGDINKNVNAREQEIFDRGYQASDTFPRTYQIELMLKSMRQDSVIYLPTGTGKTLVSVLTMCLMLEDNFQRPVIFLVDKVLLVIQQGRYIEKELKVKSKKYLRFSLNNRSEKEERLLNVAFVCGGMTHSQGIPLWQHDVIVTTAAYCFNMLEKGIIRWDHFSLAVFDEVHHCHKDHPYKKLISCYHTKITNPSRRPKVLGLSASPAGKDTVENTLEMLKRLLATLGGSRIAIPEGSSCDELKQIQSDPKLEVSCVPLTSKEQEFQLECYKYFLRCYRNLARMSALCKSQEIPLCNFNAVLHDHSEEALNFLANNLIIDPEPLSEIMPHVLNATCTLSQRSKECQEGVFDSLRLHTVNFLLNVSAIPTGVDFKEMEKIFEPSVDNHELENARSLGLPCDSMKQHILHFKQNEKKTISPMLDKVLQILQNGEYVDWDTPNAMALLLVRERKQARNVSKKLQQTELVRERGLRITHLVGHGKGANDEGMQVKQQKRVLDNHRDFHIIVATSIAEEGIDICKLGLVISMNPPSTVRALVQMRGRARLKDSHFVILCATSEEEEKLKRLIRQENNMLAAAKICLGSQS